MTVLRVCVVILVFLVAAAGNAAALLDDEEALPDTGSLTDDTDLDESLDETVDEILPDDGDSTSESGDEEDDPAGAEDPEDETTKDPTYDEGTKGDDSKLSSDLDGASKDSASTATNSKDGSGGDGKSDLSDGSPDLIKALATPGSSEFIGPVFGQADGSSSSAASYGDAGSTLGRPAARDVPATPGIHFVGLLVAIGATMAVLRRRSG